MKKGIVIRLYPTTEQAQLIIETFGCARYIYNYLLQYSKDNKIVNRFELQKQITILKQQEETSFLKKVDKFALQNACKNLSDAYNNFFRKKASFPQFKSKKKSKRSYQTNYTNGNIAFNEGHIKLPKLGLVRCSNNYRYSNDKIINVTVYQELDGKFYASIIYEANIISLPKTKKEIGIDIGTRKIVTTSDGIKYHLPTSINKLTTKCKREQRKLSRRDKDSKRYEKQRIALSKVYRKRINIVNDYMHKVSYSIVKNYDDIYMEDLDINQLLSIQENKKKKNKMIVSSLGKLIKLIQYKANMYDKQIHIIDKYYDSSKICSSCNNKYDIKDKEVYICPNCGLKIDRDYNAAINILRKGKLSFTI